jgi:hypothetical protein
VPAGADGRDPVVDDQNQVLLRLSNQQDYES